MNFGITKALADVDFSVEAGKIYGLIGENGSGKSTLASIISGIYKPVSGTMTFHGKPWAPANALYAKKNGVSIIVQEAGTMSTVSVGQNIFAGEEKSFSKFGFVDTKRMNAEANEALNAIGVLNIRAEMPIRRLNMQERKIVEIAKAYHNNPDILLIDETTNVLSQDGREILFKLIHRIKDEGKSVVMISHNISEVMDHCDEIMVLTDGHVTANLTKEEFSEDKIKSLMIGRKFTGDYFRTDQEGYSEEVVLEAKGITTLSGVTNVDVQLHKGEILGVGGLSDSGIHVLGKALFGEERLAKGELLVHGKPIASAYDAVKNKIAYISKDRDTESLALDASIADNIASTGYDVNLIFGFLSSPKKEKAYVDAQKERLSIKCNSVNQPVRSLSGGNKQKVSFGKWFAKDCDIFIMDCPTRGIDIGVKQEIYKIMLELKRSGKSIVVISEEMPELIGMSDRLLVMKNSRVAKELHRKDGITDREVIEYMV